ncbi:sensor histidine kinase [Anaerosalibacter sp. Marseille-P3206]|uniref:sensor histidine kinase n=1 Tax=Anaerosalibacter sp. Marseille-P3206 TaxID=1871005 RepID=UPI00098779B0|nr:sensor histidine kinase [Anaerosalibacter sp. Marseille-P3206]
MDNNKKLLIIRYFILTILIFSIVAYKENVDVYAVILVLIIIINNQIRFFTFKDNKYIVFISLILEWILSYICYKNYGGLVFSYMCIGIIDGVFLLKGKLSYISIGLAIFTVGLMSRNLSINEIILNVASLVTLAILSSYIVDENHRLIKAEELYDKLRISEEQLRKANADLEIYANSIKELAILRERNRISREIHDSVGHSLSTIIIQLGAIEKIAKENGEMASDMANNLGEFAKDGLNEIRTALRQLKPSEFEKYESIIAIEDLTKEFSKLTGVDVKLGFTREKWPLNREQSFVIYRIVQEFLSNSIRHGKATKVNIFMNFNENDLILTLKDNGQGVDNLEKGMGLTNICERVNELGGQVDYDTKKDKGFLMRVVVKLDKSLVS